MHESERQTPLKQRVNMKKLMSHYGHYVFIAFEFNSNHVSICEISGVWANSKVED